MVIVLRSLVRFALLTYRRFKRNWVYQEVVCARTLRVLYDNLEISWAALDWAILVYQLLITTDDSLSSASVPPQIFLEKGRPLLSLLLECRARETSDARDHCFSLLGISDMAFDPRLRPDYTENMIETFTRYATVLLDTPRGGAVLAYCFESDRRPIDLPSWAPDWSNEPHISQPMSDWTLYADDGGGSFYAAGGPPSSSSPAARLLDGNILCVRGFILDNLADIADPAEHVDVSDPTQSCALWMAWYRTLRGWQQQQDQNLTQTNDIHPLDSDAAEDLFKTTWRLLMVDRDSSGLSRASELPAETTHFHRAVLEGDNNPDNSAIEAAGRAGATRSWLTAAMTVSYGTRLCRTVQGRVATVSSDAASGDAVAIVAGCPVPLVVRPAQKPPVAGTGIVGTGGPVYRIVGRAYVDGVMDGEAVAAASERRDECLRLA
jgi:hypothetical protein